MCKSLKCILLYLEYFSLEGKNTIPLKQLQQSCWVYFFPGRTSWIFHSIVCSVGIGAWQRGPSLMAGAGWVKTYTEEAAASKIEDIDKAEERLEGISAPCCHYCWVSGQFLTQHLGYKHENMAFQTHSHLNVADGECSFLSFLTRMSIDFISHSTLVTWPNCNPIFNVLVTVACGGLWSVVYHMVTFMVTGIALIIIENADIEVFTSLFLALEIGLLKM